MNGEISEKAKTMKLQLIIIQSVRLCTGLGEPWKHSASQLVFNFK